MPESRTLPWCQQVALEGGEEDADEGRVLADAGWDSSWQSQNLRGLVVVMLRGGGPVANRLLPGGSLRPRKGEQGRTEVK